MLPCGLCEAFGVIENDLSRGFRDSASNLGSICAGEYKLNDSFPNCFVLDGGLLHIILAKIEKNLILGC